MERFLVGKHETLSVNAILQPCPNDSVAVNGLAQGFQETLGKDYSIPCVHAGMGHDPLWSQGHEA